MYWPMSTCTLSFLIHVQRYMRDCNIFYCVNTLWQPDCADQCQKAVVQHMEALKLQCVFS